MAIIILMGPAGAGKSTVGSRLAGALGWSFHDADALHSPENIESMRHGVPLDDASRSPFIEAVARLVTSLVQAGRPAVIACSALRRSFRERLHEAAGDATLVFVYLRASEPVLAARLAERRAHFFPAGLLASQIAALQEPVDDGVQVLVVNGEHTPEEIVEEIRRTLSL